MDKLTDITLDYTEKGIYEVTAKYRADSWTETRIGQINV